MYILFVSSGQWYAKQFENLRAAEELIMWHALEGNPCIVAQDIADLENINTPKDITGIDNAGNLYDINNQLGD